MIRRATVDDLSAMKNMVLRFWENVDLDAAGLHCDLETVEDTILDVLAAPGGMGFVAVDGKGAIYGTIMGVVGPWIFNRNILMLTELGWFVLPEYRGEHPLTGALLYRALTKWAKAEGATVAMFSSTARKEAEMVREFYTDKGFINTDNNYMGRI